MYLMCKDKIVYDIENDIVCCKELLPGAMRIEACKETFERWWRSRYASSGNRTAAKIKKLKYNDESMTQIDKITHGLSLVDCYYLVDDMLDINFYKTSPYNSVVSCAEPSLYVGGIQDKEWNDMGYLVKYCKQPEIEKAALDLCSTLGFSHIDCFVNNGALYLSNFTNINLMLEQANQSGKFNMYDYTDKDIIKYLGVEYGLKILFIDAVVGNGDRHPGNFGWLRNSETGVYLGPAPMYDFDHALDDRGMFLIGDFARLLLKDFRDYIDLFNNYCKVIIKSNTLDIFKDRANKILKY